MPKLGRTQSHRNLLVRNLATSLVLYESVVTTPARAKAVIPHLDRAFRLASGHELVTARRHLTRYLNSELAISKLIQELRDRKRAGGNVRMFRLPPRRGDNSAQVLLRLADGIKPQNKESHAA